MSENKKSSIKTRLHPRNKNRERYDLNALLITIPELKKYIITNEYGNESIDFSNPIAVKMLNRALLKYYYGIHYWEFPDQNLCPPIPGRADYLHYIADLLCESNYGRIPLGNIITCFDIGVGANCIYPIIGVVEYSWKFIGSDIDSNSVESAIHIVNSNPLLLSKVVCKVQKNPKDFFYGILHKDEKIDVSICNPPFHSSAEAALNGTKRKIKNTVKKELKASARNFAGLNNELIYEGGEISFITKMIKESNKFSKNCFWFTTLVSKQSNLKAIERELNNYKVSQVKIISMGTGNKNTRIVAWTFLSASEQMEWRTTRWKAKNSK